MSLWHGLRVETEEAQLKIIKRSKHFKCKSNLIIGIKVSGKYDFLNIIFFHLFS